jgi:hypothetical protein
MMDHPERYRIALDRFLCELREILARVPPDVFESPLGATLLVTALLEEASRMALGQLDEPEARKMIEGLVHAQFGADTASS